MKNRWRWALGLGLTALVLANDGARTMVRNLLELHRTGKRLERLRGEETAMTVELKSLRTDDAHLERVARGELGFIKPGDLEYRFSTQPSSPAAASR